MNSNSAPILLQVESVSKRYPNGVQAVRALDLEVRAGEVFGVVGPNGAGKSTLLKLIAGLLRPEEGRVVVDGQEMTGAPAEAARWIGLMPDPLGVYTDVSCGEYLRFFAKVYGLKGTTLNTRMASAVEALGLEPWLKAEVESLSAGWQRRLALGRMLLLDTPLLLLDEPAAGLDVRARAELLEIVRRCTGLGRTVIVSSHILPELETLADRFGIMDHGQWVRVAPGQPWFDRRALKEGLGGCRWRVLFSGPGPVRQMLDATGRCAIPVDGGLEFMADSDAEAAETLRTLVQAGAVVSEFRRVGAGLSDVVLRVLEGART